jgi:hypothetical protein
MNTTLTGKQTLLFVLVFLGGLSFCVWLRLPPLVSGFSPLLCAIVVATVFPQSRRAVEARSQSQAHDNRGSQAAISTTPPITLDYRVTMHDRREANIILARKRLPTRSPDLQTRQLFARSNLGWVLFVGFAVALFYLLGGAGRTRLIDVFHQHQAIVVSVLTALVVFFALWLFALRSIRRSIENLRLQMTFSDEGIEERNGDSVTRVNWQSFHNWSETASLFILHKSNSDSTREHGFFIPKRLFPKPETVNEFRQLLSKAVAE